EYELAAVLEEERNRAVGTEVAAGFRERVAHVGHGPGLVVGQAVHEYGGAPDAVAFIAHLLVVGSFEAPDAALDGALDVVPGHVAGIGLVHRQAQPRVGVGIAASQARCNRDFLDQPGENLAALRVLAVLAVLGVGPLAVAGHEEPLELNARPRTASNARETAENFPPRARHA